MTEISPEDWGNRYRARRATYESMTTRLRALIVHYIVWLSTARGQLAEWRQYAGIPAEIQVRTALQHAWAAVQHKLDYKSSIEAPIELRRRLFRLSALFELADEQFSELRDARARIEAEYADDVRNGQLDLPLDEASLSAYLDDSGKRHIIASMITDTGGKIYPQDERALAKDRRDLLKLLNIIEVSTISQLDDYLSANIFQVPVADTDLFRKVGLESVEDALTMLIMADRRVSRDVFGAIYLPDGWVDFARLMEKWQSIKSATIP